MRENSTRPRLHAQQTGSIAPYVPYQPMHHSFPLHPLTLTPGAAMTQGPYRATTRVPSPLSPRQTATPPAHSR
jgi:hypothetical protein